MLKRFMKLNNLIKKNHILIFILVLAFFVRAYDLGFEKIWIDEGLTVYLSQKSISDNIRFSLQNGHYPPYHILLSIWEKFFGYSSSSIRFPSVIFGTISVYVLYLIVTALFNKKLGIYSAIIMALSPFNFYYSQEARPYSYLVMMSLISIFFYIKLINSKNYRYYYPYTIFTLLMLSSHGPGIFTLVFQNVHYLLFVRKNLGKWILTQSILTILFIPLFLVIVKSILIDSKFLVVSKPGLLTLIKTFYIFTANDLNNSISLIMGSILSLIFSILLLLVIIRIIRYIKKKKYNDVNKLAFLFLWLIIPVLLLIIQSYVFYAFFWQRYVIVSSVGLYVLIAYSITKLKWRMQLLSILTIILLSAGLLYMEYISPNKENWEAVSSFIKSHQQENSVIIIHAPLSVYSFTYYYDQSCFKNDDLTSCVKQKNVFAVQNVDELPKDLDKYDQIFLVLFNSKYTDPKMTIAGYLADHYKLTSDNLLDQIGVLSFSAKVRNNPAG